MSKAKDPLAQANKARKRKAEASQRERKAQLSKLKKLGLYEGNTVRGSRGSYGASVVRKFADVLSGNAKVVKATPEAVRQARAAGGAARGDKVVIEAERGERLRYDKKTKRIIGVRREKGTGRIIRQIHFTKVSDPSKLPKPPKGKTYYYQAKFEKGATPRFSSLDAFKAYMATYQNAKLRPSFAEKFKAFWASHVSVEEVDTDRDWELEFSDYLEEEGD